MAAAFWSNTIWFVVLGISSIIEIVFVLKKARDRKHVIALYFIISGLTFCMEATICCFLKAYNYYPMLVPGSPINDNLAGNLFSQYSITSTVLLIVVFNLKYYWPFIFAGLYGIIEELFLKLGIYSHNWYRTWMSLVGFIFIFWITKKMYQNRITYRSGPFKYLFMMLGLYSLHMPVVFWTMILSGIVTPSTKIFSNDMSSFAFVSLVNLFLLIAVCIFVYFSKLKWWWKSFITLALYVILYIAYRANWLYVKDGLFLVFATIDIFGMYLCIFILDKLMTE